MHIFKSIFIAFFALIISSCGGGNSSSENDESTVIMSNGATVSFSSNVINAGEIITLSYDLDGQTPAESRPENGSTGTIRWGDVTQDRVRGSGNVRHHYGTPGTYSVSVQIDGGESERVGIVTVLEVETSSNNESNSNGPTTKVISQNGSIAVAGQQDTDTFTISNVSPGDTVTISLTCTDGTIDPVVRATDPNGNVYNDDDGGPACDSFSSSLIDSVPAVNGVWTVVSRSFASQTGPYALEITVTGTAFVTF